MNIRDTEILSEKIADKVIESCGVNVVKMSSVLSELCAQSGNSVPPKVVAHIILTAVTELACQGCLILKKQIKEN